MEDDIEEHGVCTWHEAAENDAHSPVGNWGKADLLCSGRVLTHGLQVGGERPRERQPHSLPRRPASWARPVRAAGCESRRSAVASKRSGASAPARLTRDSAVFLVAE